MPEEKASRTTEKPPAQARHATVTATGSGDDLPTDPGPVLPDPLQEIRDRYRRIRDDLRVATTQAPDADRKLWCLPGLSCLARNPGVDGLDAARDANDALCGQSFE
ncbi:hypothetical protein DEJ48_01385 [Streptomyces venezuelae]|uniref:Uncharacterized protein n=1 Tax=Streptomyces venezuelae TaxID=54571 RepID=A0A5P2BV09_STRVZ|nr:hypothetical protein [Streptomyces venezuelae]QES32249.1 hypothetical protein DEJ48_01385 [Streptomyces venezuelae]